MSPALGGLYGRQGGHFVVVAGPCIDRILEHVLEVGRVPCGLAHAGAHSTLFQQPREDAQSGAAGKCLEQPPDNRALLLVNDQARRRGGRFLHVLVPIWRKPMAKRLSHAKPMELSPHKALGDLSPLVLGNRPQKRQRQLVFGVPDVVLAFDDDLLAVLERAPRR